MLVESISSPASLTSLPKKRMVLSKIRDYVQLLKLRLTLLVVFSAAAAFIISSPGAIEWSKLWLLVLGGFLVTGASNGFNQVIERDLDKLMARTSTRPLPDSRMQVVEALTVAMLMGISGIFILGHFMNLLSGCLGAIALLLYTFAYTPMKRATPFAVFVGAFPGAIPPLLGAVAATGTLNDIHAWVLFSIQFIWQFPHFWAIAWVLDDDYKKAGFKMLPSAGGRNKASAFQPLVYSMTLIPMSLLPFHFHIAGPVSAIIMGTCGVLFSVQAFYLYKTCSLKAARQLMFGSFIYLPVVLIALIADKL